MKFYLIIFKLHALETGIHLDPQYPIDSRESEIIRLKHGKNVYPPCIIHRIIIVGGERLINGW